MRRNSTAYKVFANHLFEVALVCALASCGIPNEVKVKLSKELSATTAESVTPLFANPSEVVTVTGKDFLVGKAYKAVFKVSASQNKEVPMSVVNGTTATFLMPEGMGAGEKNFDIVSGKRTLNSFSIIATEGSGIDYYSGDASKICTSDSFFDKTGKVQKGTKDCATGSVADCTADGQTGCRTTVTYKAANTGSIVATDLKSGKILAGISGSLAECSADGATGCVTTSSYRSVDTALATVGNIRSTITLGGTLGTFSGGFSNCTSDSQVGCVTTASFRAADMSVALSSNIRTGVTIAGAPGDIVLPTASNVYSGVTFGSASASIGTLTIPTAGNVRSAFGAFGVGGSSVTPSLGDCSADGSIGCVTTASYKSADVAVAIAGNIRSGFTIGGQPGSLTPSPANCSSGGQQSCVATGTYFAGTACAASGSACYLPTYVLTSQPLRAISFDALDAGKTSIRSTLTVGGVTGTLADCSTNNATGCVTTATYQSGDLTNLSAANVRSGVTIAGQAGDFPSATNTLSGASVTADLDAATFNAKVKSSTAFEYWTSSGSRQTGAGDADILDTNIANLVDIFGTTGNLAGGAAPDAWDLRSGVVVGSVTGRLQVNCNNGNRAAVKDISALKLVSINTSNVITLNSHGFANNDPVAIIATTMPSPLTIGPTYYVRSSTTNTFTLALTSGGADIDITTTGSEVLIARRNDGTPDVWDTIDDNAGTGYSDTTILTSSPFGASALCGGAGTASDSKTWTDVTTTTCDSAGDQCRYKDKITKLEWSESFFLTSSSFVQAYQTCDDLIHDGFSDWRLPTQKELLGAYAHGIRSVSNNNWVDVGSLREDIDGYWTYFWSTTTGGMPGSWYWIVNLAQGDSIYRYSYTTTQNTWAICVRP